MTSSPIFHVQVLGISFYTFKDDCGNTYVLEPLGDGTDLEVIGVLRNGELTFKEDGFPVVSDNRRFLSEDFPFSDKLVEIHMKDVVSQFRDKVREIKQLDIYSSPETDESVQV